MSDPVIYVIRQIGTEKVYVGSTNCWKRRLGEHRSTLRSGTHCNKHLQAAWSKHGESEFAFSVVEHVVDVSLIVAREQHWIDTLQAAKHGFNMCPAAGTTRGKPCSPERAANISASKQGHVQREPTKALIRAARARQVITAESAAKTRAGNTGKKRTAEFCARISEARTGVSLSQETRAKIAAANTGKKASEETRAKMSASALALGRTMSPEQRAAVSARMTGRTLSPDSIAKRQATRRANAQNLLAAPDDQGR